MPPDFGAPVAQNVQAPNFTQTLGGLMGLQQQKQAIQSGALQIQQQQQNLQVGANNAQAAQQTQQERQRVTQMFQTGKDDQGNSIVDPRTGEPDPTRVLPALGRIAPLTGQDYAQNILKTITAKVGLQSAATNLDSTQRAALLGPIQSLAVNPTDDQIGQVNSTLDSWGKQHPEMATNVAQAKLLVSHIQSVQDPGKRSEMANKLGALFQGGQAVQTQPSPSSVNTGSQTQIGTSAPPVAGGAFTPATAVQQQVPPGTGVWTDPRTGNPYAYNPQAPQATVPLGGGTPLPGSPAPAAQPSPGKFGTPGDVLDRLRQTESSGNDHAVNPSTGAMGPYQFTPQTLAAMHQAGIKFDPFDPEQSRDAADRYLARLTAQNGGDMRKAVAQYGGFVTKDPSGYVDKILGPQAQPGGTAPPRMTVGEADQVSANTKTVTQNRQQAQDAQIQHDILGRIQQLSSTPGLYLGPGSQQVANLATMVSQLPGMEGAAKYSNNYNELTKFMAQNAARQGASMGLSGSDARVDMATHAQPNADPMDPRTVQNVSQYMGGIVRMQLAKADAMDNWMKQPGNGLQNEHEFEKVWRDNADPRLFQLAEMTDQGDAVNYSRLHINKGELGALQKKHDTLVGLGALPGAGAPAAPTAPASAAGAPGAPQGAGGATGAW